MAFELQPTLENERIRVEPLCPDDFEALYAVASDPLLWQQHPNRYRYRREQFATFFQGAVESQSALRVLDNVSRTLIGCSRYYDLDESKREVAIGYTFVARSHWGGASNRALKSLMLEHAFGFVDRVIFHVGAVNLRSRKAMEKLGAVVIGEIAMSYYGEQSHPNIVYKIDKGDWRSRPQPTG
jgi:RimJ/RimL family protein N-acetyltransferase